MIRNGKLPVLVISLAATACSAAMAQAGAAPGAGQSPQLATQGAAASSPLPAALPDTEGRAIFEANCSSCHEITDATSQAKDLAGWTETIAKMVSYGAPVAAEDQERIATYLAATYPARQL